MKRYLAISGSLRARSSNTEVLKAAAASPPEGCTITVWRGLANIPAFNPDLDDTPPQTVVDFRESIRRSDAVLVCSPEYAHGVPGALKNALDWTVSSDAWIDKPVLLINTSPRATLAHRALFETLRVMNARVFEADISLPRDGTVVDADVLRRDPALSACLLAALRRLP